MKAKKDEISVKKLLDIFLPKLWIIAIASIVLAGAFAVYSQFIQKNVYSAHSKYMVVKVPYTDDDSLTTGLNSNEIQGMQGMIANAKEVINTKDFCNEVIDLVGVNMTAKQLMPMVSVSLCNEDTTCFYFDVKTPDPVLSYDVADVAGELLKVRLADTGYAIRIERIDSPVEPDAPDSKNVVRNAVIGFAIGFLVSVIAIFVISKFDVVIRDKDKLENTFDIPILGVIPRPEMNK